MKIINALLLCFGLSNTVNAQVEIREYTGTGGTQVGNDISGTTFDYLVTENHFHVHFAVKNVSGADARLRIRRLRIDVPGSWQDAMSWAQDPDTEFEGMCFTYSQLATNPWTTPYISGQPGLSQMIRDGNIGHLNIEINASSAGVGHYRYYVVANDGVELIDSIDLNVSVPLSITEENEGLSVSAYPNPANTFLTISTTGIDESVNLRITDVLGKLIFTEVVSPLKKIDVSEFKNGVYLVSIFSDGRLLQTQRVVVKH